MNHCIDVICANCGLSYCLLGCAAQPDSNPALSIEALHYAWSTTRLPAFHYKQHICRGCGEKKVFSIPSNFNEALQIIQHKNRGSRN